MTTRSFMASVLVLAIAFPAQVLAETKGVRATVAVGDLKLPEEWVSREAQFQTVFLNAFARQPGVRTIPKTDVDRYKLANRITESHAPSLKKLKEARELLSRGKSAYNVLNFKSAVALLEEARRQFILMLNELRSNRDLIDAHLYLGLSYAATNEKEKAADEFRRVVYLDPRRELSTREFSPKVVGIFTKVRQEVMAEDPIRVRIESVPSEANVYVNGKSSGVTPVEISTQPGEYFILVEKPGMATWYQPTEVKRRIENIRVQLKPSSQDRVWMEMFRTRESPADQNSDDLPDLTRFAEGVSANIVFLGAIEKSGSVRLLGQLYDVRTRDFSKVVVTELSQDLSDFADSAQDVVEALMSLIRSDGYVDPAKKEILGLSPNDLTVGAADRPKEAMYGGPAPDKPWYKRWWIWPLVGGIAVGAFFGARTFTQSSQSGKIVINNGGNF